MKTKSLLFVFIFSLLAFSGYSAAVTVQEAQTVALNFFKLNTANTPSRTINTTLKFTGITADSVITYYVFDMAPAKGFVIVSATYNDAPIIGFSTESDFASDFAQTGLNDWLQRWTQEIHYVVKNNIVADIHAASLWAAYRGGVQPATLKSSGVGPLCSTTWNQSPLYNLDCPQYSVTGCVATAMAQIMKYWNYPPIGNGAHSYSDMVATGYQNNIGTLTFNFGGTTFNWAAMPNALGSSTTVTQDSAVALLMYACGVSVNMDYSVNGSGAWVATSESTTGASSQQAYPLYFNYNPNTIQAAEYNNSSPQQWYTMLQNEFDHGRPVQYQGYSTSGGHSWVCDGYNTAQMVHMNWGWGGQDNGWYALTNLNPGGEIFDNDIRALIGIEPGGYAQATSSVICTGNSTTLSVANVPQNVTYNWFPATGLNCTTCANPVASPAVTTTYSVTVNSPAYQDSSSITIHVNQPNSMDYHLSDSSLCSGSAAILSLYGETGVSISPLTGISWADSITALLAPNTTTTYQIACQSSVCGTGASRNITIGVIPHAPVTLNLSTNTICAGGYATLTYSGLTNVTVVQGNDFFFSDSGLVFAPYATTFYMINGTTSCGSIYTDTFTITVANNYALNYTISKTSICAGSSSVLTVYGDSVVQVNPANLVVPLGNNKFLLKPDSTTTFQIGAYILSQCNVSYRSQTFNIFVVNNDSLQWTLSPVGQACGGQENIITLFGASNIQSNPPLTFNFYDSAYAQAYFFPDTSVLYTISAQTVCGTYSTAHIYVQAHPQFSYTLQPGTICAGDTALLTFKGLSAGQILSPTTGFTVIDSSHYKLFPDSTTTYSFKGSTCYGNITNYLIPVRTVNPGVLNYTISDTVACPGSTTYLRLNGVTNPQITPYNSFYRADSTDYYTLLTPAATTSYSVSAQSVCGGTLSQNFRIHVAEQGNYLLQSGTICPGSSTTLTFMGITNPVLTTYDTALNHSILWLNDSVARLSPLITTTYHLMGGNYCINNYSQITVTVVTDTEAHFVVSDTVLCVGSQDYLRVSGVTGITVNPPLSLSYIDSFDAYAYFQPLNENTTYIVSGTAGCTGKLLSDTFNVRMVLPGGYTISHSTLCKLSDTAILSLPNWQNVQILPAYNYYLRPNKLDLFPDTTTTYTLHGYSRCYYVPYTKYVTITVDHAPPIIAAPDYSVLCGGGAIVCASGGFVHYTWSTGQTGECATAPVSGYYTVTGTDAANCSSLSTPQYVDVSATYQPDITSRYDTLFAPVADKYQWLLNGVPLPAATGPWYIAGDTGIYSVLLNSNNGCQEISKPYNADTIAANRNSSVTVYPNPTADNWIVLTGADWIGSRCQIFDIAGKLIFTQEMVTDFSQINGGNLAGGVYLLRLVSGKNRFSTKLVKL